MATRCSYEGRSLVGGTLMLTLALAMVATPGALESVGGTAAVFGLAAVAVAAVLLIEVWRRRTRPPTHHAGART